MLNAKLEHHMTGPHAFSHEDSAFIYILVLCPCDARFDKNILII